MSDIDIDIEDECTVIVGGYAPLIGPMLLTLPEPSDAVRTFSIYRQDMSHYVVTVVGGAASVTLEPLNMVRCAHNGRDWFLVKTAETSVEYAGEQIDITGRAVAADDPPPGEDEAFLRGWRR